MKHLLFVTRSADLSESMGRRIFNTARILRKNRYRIVGLFEQRGRTDDRFAEAFDQMHYIDPIDPATAVKELKSQGFSVAFVHEAAEPRLLAALLAEKFKLITFIHNHDWYCPTRHKRYPLIDRTCTIPFSPVACSLCSLFTGGGRSRPIARHRELMTLVKRSRRFLVMSEFMAGQLRKNGFKQQRIEKLYPPVVGDATPSGAAPDRGDLTEILFVGRLIAAKGPDLLLDAARLIDRPFRLRFIGTGPLEADLKKKARGYGLGDKILFEGAVENADLFLERADIVAVPSRWPEPFAMVGIEAFAHGRPVVGFSIGGIGEWLIHQFNGLLAKPGDTADLAARLTELIDDPAKREQFGRNGMTFVETHCTEERFVAQFNRIYDDVHVIEKTIPADRP
ncbi:MAG TPA: glycosyltransferase family 4 protein [bacterium]|nr:glycosyltransferase family 4 protein [bacterium]